MPPSPVVGDESESLNPFELVEAGDESVSCGGTTVLAPATFATLVRPSQAQPPAVLDHACPLPQRDRSARPALDRGPVGREHDLIILNAGDVLDDVLAVGCPTSMRKAKCDRITAIAPVL